MTHSLYYKFIIGYLVFGLLGFITIATISSDMTYDFLLETKSDALYDEANMLASDFSQLYRGRNSNLNEAAPRLKAAATYREKPGSWTPPDISWQTVVSRLKPM